MRHTNGTPFNCTVFPSNETYIMLSILIAYWFVLLLLLWIHYIDCGLLFTQPGFFALKFYNTNIYSFE